MMRIFSSTEEKIIDALHDANFDKALELIKSNNVKVNNLITRQYKIGKNTVKERTTILHSAISKHAPFNIIDELLKKGVNINITVPDQNTPLHGCKDIASIYYLLKNGAKTDKRNVDGDTPVDIQRRMIDSCYKYNWGESTLNNYTKNLSLLLSFNAINILRNEYTAFYSDKQNEYGVLLDKLNPILSEENSSVLDENKFPEFYNILLQLENFVNSFKKGNTDLLSKENQIRYANDSDLEEPLNWHLSEVKKTGEELKNKINSGVISKILQIKTRPPFKYRLGNLFYDNEQYDKAIEVLKEIEGIDIQINNTVYPMFMTYHVLADCYDELNNYNKAADYIQLSLNSYKKLHGYSYAKKIEELEYKFIIRIFYQAKKWKEGLNFLNEIEDSSEYLEEAFVEFNKKLENWNDLGLFYENKGDKSKAQEYYKLANNDEKLITFSESDGDYLALAKLLDKQGDFENAAINYYKAAEYKVSQKLWLKLKSPDEYFQCLTKTNKVESINDLDVFDLNDIITYSIKHKVSVFAAEYLISQKYFELDSSHINLIQPLYNALLALENKNEIINNYIFLLSLKLGVIQDAMLVVNEMFSKHYSILLDGNLSDEIAKKTIQKLLQLNSYRLAFNKDNQDYKKLQEKLFDEFRLLSFDNFKGYDTILKYKVAQSVLQQNWNLFSTNLSLINTEYPQLSKFGSLLKILIDNLLDENKDKLESLEQYWRYSKKEFKQIERINPNNISEIIFKLIELQPEYFIYNYWKDYFFGEKQSSEKFAQELNLIIEKINGVNGSEENSLTSLIHDFVNFYNSFESEFKSEVSVENQINILSRMCQLTEESDLTLHTNLIEILENEYDYEYGV